MDGEILKIVAAAIQAAKVKFPNAGYGTKWDQIFTSDEESRHFAKAIISELSSAGYHITKDGE